MSEQIDADQARQALAVAEASGGAAARSGRWYALYSVVYAAMSVALTLAVGLAPSVWTIGGGTVLWLIAVGALSTYALRRPVAPRRYALLHTSSIVAWGVIYMVVMFGGTTGFRGDPAWWVPGALLTAVPPLVAAAVAVRRPAGVAAAR
ncbi:hypothetical protein ACFOVU_13725 [Nocardiopsis sediminis]|uniref:Sensor histidine kinase n=1 Tax=Nocardiopsis sediminis TaxID=1778267 RepID=A0ABV8FLF5_9ACTN